MVNLNTCLDAFFAFIPASAALVCSTSGLIYVSHKLWDLIPNDQHKMFAQVALLSGTFLLSHNLCYIIAFKAIRDYRKNN